MARAKKQSTSIENHLHDHQYRWFAIYTRYKSEKLVSDMLIKKGIEAYVPLLHYTRKYKSKTKQVSLPLINCYVFVKITKQEYVKVLQTEHVIHFLRLRSHLISIPDAEIQTLRWVVGEKMEIEVHENRGLEKGVPVEVIAGNLTGLKGKIVKRKNKKFFVVNLETVGYTLQVNIAEELLEVTNRLETAT